MLKSIVDSVYCDVATPPYATNSKMVHSCKYSYNFNDIIFIIATDKTKSILTNKIINRLNEKIEQSLKSNTNKFKQGKIDGQTFFVRLLDVYFKQAVSDTLVIIQQNNLKR